MLHLRTEILVLVLVLFWFWLRLWLSSLQSGRCCESSPEASQYVYLDLMQVWKSNKHVAAAVTRVAFISPEQAVGSKRLKKRRICRAGKEKSQLSVSLLICLHQSHRDLNGYYLRYDSPKYAKVSGKSQEDKIYNHVSDLITGYKFFFFFSFFMFLYLCRGLETSTTSPSLASGEL